MLLLHLRDKIRRLRDVRKYDHVYEVADEDLYTFIMAARQHRLRVLAWLFLPAIFASWLLTFNYWQPDFYKRNNFTLTKHAMLFVSAAYNTLNTHRKPPFRLTTRYNLKQLFAAYKYVTKKYSGDIVRNAAISFAVCFVAVSSLISWLVGEKLFVLFFAGLSLVRRRVTGAGVEKDCKKALKVLTKNKADGLRVHPDFCLPMHLEQQHIMYLGSSGSGKTATMLHAIQHIRERKEKAVIYDFKGDFTAYFAEDDDVLLIDLLDARSAGWDIFEDITNADRAETLAKMLLPDSKKDPYWTAAAAEVFAAVWMYLQHNNNLTYATLLRTISNYDALKNAIETVSPSAAQHIQGSPQESAQTQGVLANMREAVRLFEVAERAGWGDEEKEKISVNSFLASSKYNVIILRANPEYEVISKQLISAFYDTLFRKTLTLADDSKRRIWIVLDELPTLGHMPLLLDTLNNARSKGVCFVLGLQNISSLRDAYGINNAVTLVSQVASLWVGKSNDAETAATLAKAAGTTEIQRARVNPDGAIVWGEVRVESLLIDSDMMALPYVREVKKQFGSKGTCGYWKFPDKPLFRVITPFSGMEKRYETHITKELKPSLALRKKVAQRDATGDEDDVL